MKTITISYDLEQQILGTPTQLALKHGAEIFLVNSIKVGRNRTYIEMESKEGIKTRNLKTLIKKGMEFITSAGNMFTPKSFDGSMFILNDGKKIATGYTSPSLLHEHGTYCTPA